jgi:response regulator of citrate/malate metabolism
MISIKKKKLVILFIYIYKKIGIVFAEKTKKKNYSLKISWNFKEIHLLRSF